MFLLLAGLIILYTWVLPQGWTLPERASPLRPPPHPPGRSGAFAPLPLPALGPPSQGLPAALLVIVGLLVASAMMSVFVLALLLLELAALLTVFVVQAGRPGRTEAASHFFMIILLAVPPLLLGARFLDLYQLSPDRAGFLTATITLLAIGFALILGVLPFHVWLPTVTSVSPPLASAVILSLLQPGLILLLVRLLGDAPPLGQDPRTTALLIWGGAVSAVGGALLTLPRRRLGRLLAYSAVSGLGVILLGLGSGSELGRAGALFQAPSQALSVLLLAMGMGVFRFHLASDEIADCAGLLRRMPVTTLSFLIGGASLAGLPGTNGFVARWLVYRAVSDNHPQVVLVFLLASALLAGAFLRFLLQTARHLDPPPSRDEPLPVAALMATVAVLVLALGLVPGPVLEVINRAGQTLP